MSRWAWVFVAIPAWAQPAPAPPDPLAAREALARKRNADWETLAKGLDAKIAHMLPCDARVRGAIEEVSRASEARLAAISDYLNAAQARAATDSQRAHAAVTEEHSAMRELGTERAEAEQRRTAIDAQIADLKDSARRRPVLDGGVAKLGEIRGMTEERIAQLAREASERQALRDSLESLAASYDARAKAMDAEVTAFSPEAARWLAYYAARLTRAGTECSITSQARPQRKKQ